MGQSEAGNRGNDQGSSGAALNAGGDEDGARAFIAQVKEELERCLGAGMSKEKMFQELHGKGFHPAAAFAVYKELRDQNNDWFREHYVKMDLRKQAERLQLLLHHYRTVRAANAAARAQGTAGQQTAMAAVPNDVGLPGHWSTVPVGLDGTGLVSTSSSGEPRFAAPYSQLPSPATTTHAPTGQPLHQREQPVPDGGVQGVLEPSAACTAFNGAMAVTYPWSCTDNVHTDNVGTMWLLQPPQQWWPGASAGVVPSWGSNCQLPSSVQMPPENREHHDRPAPGPGHGEQAEQPLLIDGLRLGEYGNPQVHVAPQHGEQAHEPLHQWQTASQPQAPYRNRHGLAASE
ncbi:hypothetical protein ZWY2020_013646 [Hordeum vulgare]|nr:hypothetical protein ZWY2020_013646 [Hordeum vulgare]